MIDAKLNRVAGEAAQKRESKMSDPCQGEGATHYACDCTLKRVAELEAELARHAWKPISDGGWPKGKAFRGFFRDHSDRVVQDVFDNGELYDAEKGFRLEPGAVTHYREAIKPEGVE
jgi:hypothetical protein